MPTQGLREPYSVSPSNLTHFRIIKDFYISEVDPLKRPKVFGMTASPVDAREDVVKAAKYVTRNKGLLSSLTLLQRIRDHVRLPNCNSVRSFTSPDVDQSTK